MVNKITKEWCNTHKGKTESERKKCHRLLHGKDSKAPERKYKKRK